jgi:uncharacterized protein (DUF1697 family)
MHQAKLKEFFESLGFENVKPVISSGNVVFDSSSSDQTKLESKIEKEIPKKLGYNSTTIIRSEDQLKNLVKKNPFKGKEDVAASRFNITFLKKAPFEITYTVNTTVQGNTPNMMAHLEKEHGKEITTRTWKTILRILKKMDQA